VPAVALHFSVSRRTVQEWLDAGAPGKTDKGYDVEAIGAWRGENRKPRKAEPTAAEGELTKWAIRKEAAVAQQKELELAQQRGELVDVDYVARLFERTIAEHNTLLAQFKDRILQLLPAKIKPDDRKRILAGIDKAADDLRSLMATAAEEWAAEHGEDE